MGLGSWSGKKRVAAQQYHQYLHFTPYKLLERKADTSWKDKAGIGIPSTEHIPLEFVLRLPNFQGCKLSEGNLIKTSMYKYYYLEVLFIAVSS